MYCTPNKQYRYSVHRAKYIIYTVQAICVYYNRRSYILYRTCCTIHMYYTLCIVVGLAKNSTMELTSVVTNSEILVERGSEIYELLFKD